MASAFSRSKLIENMWDALGRQVAGRNYPPTNKNTLICALTEEWDKLPQQLLDNAVQSRRRSKGHFERLRRHLISLHRQDNNNKRLKIAATIDDQGFYCTFQRSDTCQAVLCVPYDGRKHYNMDILIFLSSDDVVAGDDVYYSSFLFVSLFRGNHCIVRRIYQPITSFLYERAKKIPVNSWLFYVTPIRWQSVGLHVNGVCDNPSNPSPPYESLVYADKPQTLDHLEDNIRRVIVDIRPQMLKKVIENWTLRLDYIRASRGSRMPEIIFKM
ncbi:hypothetical protein TNCV_1931951 [Trichonephila clavipes]|nr:hypothetical protein TNCV_1931951 [Trichonephila clavipes]